MKNENKNHKKMRILQTKEMQMISLIGVIHSDAGQSFIYFIYLFFVS